MSKKIMLKHNNLAYPTHQRTPLDYMIFEAQNISLSQCKVFLYTKICFFFKLYILRTSCFHKNKPSNKSQMLRAFFGTSSFFLCFFELLSLFITFCNFLYFLHLFALYITFQFFFRTFCTFPLCCTFCTFLHTLALLGTF